MIESLDELKDHFKSIKEENIIFKPYFFEKRVERPYLNKEEVIESVKDIDKLLGFQKQVVKGEERYRIGIKLSNRYTLVLVAEIKEKGLNIITAWKTSRKWQKAIQK